MSNLAFLVDGRMEQKIIQTLCPNAPVRLINCNGDDVAIPRMADFIETHLRLFNNRHYPIVIVIDREGRDETAECIENTLRGELLSRGYTSDQIIIGVADRCTENWILAGDPATSSYFDSEMHLRPREGRGGKAELKRQLQIDSYSETHDGYNLFIGSSCSKMVQNSASFKNFFEAISPTIDCWWLST